MNYRLPGKKSRALLEQGTPFLRDGKRYDMARQKSVGKGFSQPAQIIVDRAEGDFIRDLDGNRYIDFQNGWATNPLGTRRNAESRGRGYL